MHSRQTIALFLCGWMAIFPLRIGAGEGEPKLWLTPPTQRLDLVPAMGSTNLPETLPRRQRTAIEWAKHRRQTARQRVNAIAHVKNSRWIPNITYAQIQEIYDAKKAALAKVVSDGGYRRTLIVQAKARALAEVRAIERYYGLTFHSSKKNQGCSALAQPPDRPRIRCSTSRLPARPRARRSSRGSPQPRSSASRR